MRDAKPIRAEDDRSIDAVEGDSRVSVGAVCLQQTRREGADGAEEQDDQEAETDEPTVRRDLTPDCVVVRAHDDSLSVRTML
jgi:hypothetical protein